MKLINPPAMLRPLLPRRCLLTSNDCAPQLPQAKPAADARCLSPIDMRIRNADRRFSLSACIATTIWHPQSCRHEPHEWQISDFGS